MGMTLRFFRVLLPLQKSKGNSLSRGYKYTGWQILLFSTDITAYLGNGTWYAGGCYGSLIEVIGGQSTRVSSSDLERQDAMGQMFSGSSLLITLVWWTKFGMVTQVLEKCGQPCPPPHPKQQSPRVPKFLGPPTWTHTVWTTKFCTVIKLDARKVITRLIGNADARSVCGS